MGARKGRGKALLRINKIPTARGPTRDQTSAGVATKIWKEGAQVFKVV